MALDPNRLTFAQAQGVAPLPTQLALKTVSRELSARVWSVIYEDYKSHVYSEKYSYTLKLSGQWLKWTKEWWVEVLFKSIDEYPSHEPLRNLIKQHINSENYLVVFDFIQFVARSAGPKHYLTDALRTALEKARSAYRLVGDLLVPVTSDEQAAAVSAALDIAREAAAQGPFSHLRSAATALSAGHWAQAVQESINAVEGAAKAIEPAADTLGPALTKLQETIGLPPALRKAFGALYGWTSDEKGLRHALVLEGQANVSERDAIFMFGACSSFVGYLLAAEPALSPPSGAANPRSSRPISSQ